jgi:hypothetical protein
VTKFDRLAKRQTLSQKAGVLTNFRNAFAVKWLRNSDGTKALAGSPPLLVQTNVEMEEKMTTLTKILAATVIAASIAGSGAAFAHGPGGQMKSGAMAPQMGQTQMGTTMMQGSGNMPGPGNMAGAGNMMGPGMMMQNGMGSGMMMQGGGMGPGMMMGAAGMPCQNSARTTDLNADDVSAILTGQLRWKGFKHLKVGNIVADKDGALIADITTSDGSLAWKVEVDPSTGAMHIADE